MAANLYILSGKCYKGLVGKPTGQKAFCGTELCVGDIVLLWRGHYIDTDIENWTQAGMTAIVEDRYTTYSDGSVVINTEPQYDFYCMGIASCGFDDPEWRIEIIKSHEDVIEGEHWRQYGFNYRTSHVCDMVEANFAKEQQ